MSVPFTRTLPYVLRDAIKGAETSGLRLMVGTVVSSPDARHIVVSIQGQNFTVPRLKSYNPANAGDPAYLLVGPSLLLAIGTVQ